MSQELEFHKTDKYALNSLKKAIQKFDDAFLALQAVEESDYKTVDKVFPHNDTEYRVSGFPKDAFHIACISHKTRFENILKVPGFDPIEKQLVIQRLANLPVAQSCYIEKQKIALENK